MRRFEAIQAIMEIVADEIVVSNLGHPSQELYAIKDRPQNFYMLGSMGLASSIGLGIAMSTDRLVVVIDGDGSILMNLGSLATIGVVRPRNLILVIVDNEAYGSTGFQPSFTSRGIDLQGMAKASNIVKTAVVTTQEAVRESMREFLESAHGPYCLLVKAARGMTASVGVVPLGSHAIRDRFMRSIRSE